MPEVKKNTVLQSFLFESMPEISRSRIRQFLRNGRIQVNGVAVSQYDTPLSVGDKVALDSRKSVRSTGLNSRYVCLVYEDRHLVVVEKREGILSMATSHHSFCVKTVLDNYFERTRQHCRAHIVHRLDRDTSGLMIYTKDRDTQQRFEANWKGLVFDRRYVAVAKGTLGSETGTVTSWLKDNKQFFTMSSPVDNGGKIAITHYKVIKRGEKNTLVELKLETGRKNQIRVHLSDLHHPVVGDRKYGTEAFANETAVETGRTYLHALRLYFHHPVTGEEFRFSTPIPPAFLAAL